jgi:hypothetical protein
MYENWLADQADVAELAKNHAYLLGSFWNPEAVKQMMDSGTHQSTEAEFEESSNIVRDYSKALEEIKNTQSNTTRKRKRRLVKG